MPTEIRIYRLHEFIRINSTGIIDVVASKRIIHQISVASAGHSIKNILVDGRETTISDSLSFGDLLEIIGEFCHYLSDSSLKVAHVIPDDERRIAIAQQAKDILGMNERRYQFFTDFEKAIDWLSGIEDREGAVDRMDLSDGNSE